MVAFLGKFWKDEALTRHRDEKISSRSHASILELRMLMVSCELELELYKVAAAGCELPILFSYLSFYLAVCKWSRKMAP